MTTVNIYLTFNGNCEEAFLFYKSVFGGEFPYIGKFKDMPDGQGKPVTAEELDRVMHVSLPISNETMLMGSDVGGEWASSYTPGNNFSISVNCDTTEEADRIFKGLAEGGQVTMPLSVTFWNAYFGMLIDKFGINWMFNVEMEGQK